MTLRSLAPEASASAIPPRRHEVKLILFYHSSQFGGQVCQFRHSPVKREDCRGFGHNSPDGGRDPASRC